MKKLTALLVTCFMIISLAVVVSAYWEPEEAFLEVKFTIGKQTTAWNADGQISDGEYYKVEIDPSWISYAINDNDTDAGLEYAKATHPELYMSWDENYIYTATRYEVTKGHENLWDGDPASMWYSGAVQFNYANFDEVASEYRLEYGVGLSSDTGDMLYTVWADGAGTGFTPSEENAKVWLDGNTLTYETKVAWEDFADEDNTAGKEGLGFNFCLVWSIGEGQDYVHIQLAEGCTGNGKHAENFAQVTLGPAPEASSNAAAASAEKPALATVGKAGDFDDIQLPGTNTAPVIDGKLDDCYVKIHDFYAPDEAMWYDNEDAAHEAKGEAWGTWDADNFYAFFKVEEADYFPQNGEADPPGSNYSSMYLALLATPPVNDLPENDLYVMQCSFNRSIEDTKEWKYTGSVPEQFRDNSGAYAIYDTCPFDFEVVNDGIYTCYEVKMPWDQIDRTGNVDFSVGHKWFFNYIITFTTDSGHAIVQYGQGLMNDIYDMGGLVTLTAAPGGSAPAAETEASAASGERAVVETGADGSLQIPKTAAPMVMDGLVDDGYAKLHDFYAADGFRTDYDADKTIKGTSYTAWDDNNFYMLLDVETPEYEPIFDTQAIDMGIGPAGYIALLGTADGSYTDDQRFEIGIALADEDIQVWKVSSPADIKDSSADNLWFDECPFNYAVRRDEATNHIYYEFGVPWSFLDRTEMLTYEEGSQFVLNYAANVHTTSDYSAGASHIVEFGGGIWAGSYTDGQTVTLVAGPAAAEEAPAAPTYPASGTEGNAIIGTVIGNETGWGDNAAAGAAAAFDGDAATFFDPLGVGDGFCGIDAGESYILDKVVILSRDGWNDRFVGAMIQGSNDGENWTTLWTSGETGTNPDYYTVTEFENNTGYSQFRYFNETNHGDVAEVEFYGNPGKVEEAPADPNAPSILWDFNADGAMDANMGASSGPNAVSWTGEADADGNEYYVFTASGPDPYVSVDLSAADVSDVVWAKARVKNAGPALSIELYGATDGRGLAGPECTHIDLASDGEWHTYLISVPEENVKTANAYKGADLSETYWTGAVNWIRLDPMWIEGDGATEDGDQIMIDYIAFFPTKEAAEAFRSEQDNAVGASVDEALDQKANPNTFDFGVIAAVAAVISLGGFAVAKKKH